MFDLPPPGAPPFPAGAPPFGPPGGFGYPPLPEAAEPAGLQSLIDNQNRMTDAMAMIMQAQAGLVHAVSRMSETVGTLAQVLNEMSRPKTIVRDAQGKVVGIKPTDETL